MGCFLREQQGPSRRGSLIANNITILPQWYQILLVPTFRSGCIPDVFRALGCCTNSTLHEHGARNKPDAAQRRKISRRAGPDSIIIIAIIAARPDRGIADVALRCGPHRLALHVAAQHKGAARSSAPGAPLLSSE